MIEKRKKSGSILMYIKKKKQRWINECEKQKITCKENNKEKRKMDGRGSNV